MKAALAVAALLVALAPSVRGSGDPQEQTVTPITPPQEQRVEPLAPQGEQHVEALDAAGVQKITGESKSPARRAADTGAKVVLGVVAAAVSIGVMVASLLLL